MNTIPTPSHTPAPATTPKGISRIFKSVKTYVFILVTAAAGYIWVETNSSIWEGHTRDLHNTMSKIQQIMGEQKMKHMEIWSPADFGKIIRIVKDLPDMIDENSPIDSSMVQNGKKALTSLEDLKENERLTDDDIDKWLREASEHLSKLSTLSTSELDQALRDSLQKFIEYAWANKGDAVRSGWSRLNIFKANWWNDGWLDNINQELGTTYTGDDIDRAISDIWEISKGDLLTLIQATNGTNAIIIALNIQDKESFPMNVEALGGMRITSKKHLQRVIVDRITDAQNGIGTDIEWIIKLFAGLALLWKWVRKYSPTTQDWAVATSLRNRDMAKWTGQKAWNWVKWVTNKARPPAPPVPPVPPVPSAPGGVHPVVPVVVPVVPAVQGLNPIQKDRLEKELMDLPPTANQSKYLKILNEYRKIIWDTRIFIAKREVLKLPPGASENDILAAIRRAGFDVQ